MIEKEVQELSDGATYTLIRRPPSVHVLAYTQPVPEAVYAYVEEQQTELNRDIRPDHPTDIAVIAGAGCYVSFNNKAGRTNSEYLDEAIIEHKHESVLEHVNLTFGINYLPRTTLIELTRHRVGIAYSIRSTRFTTTDMSVIVPPNIRGNEQDEASFLYAFHAQYTAHKHLERSVKERLKQSGTLTTTELRKKSREAARGVLPTAFGTSGVITMNARTLRHIVQLRTDIHADESFREFAYELYKAADHYIPDVLQPESVVIDPKNPVPCIRFYEDAIE